MAASMTQETYSGWFRRRSCTHDDAIKAHRSDSWATGQIGRFILEHLKHEPDTVHIRIATRRPEQVAGFQQQGQDAVLLDLDRPATFAVALHAVDRVFLLTGYTVAMLAQSKAFVDAARKARVQHIVHLGVFGHWDCTDPHIAWHQLVETYTKQAA
jgi:uncharacterized protein YbjT (DUF2867 family)